jgi:hypothetical protein
MYPPKFSKPGQSGKCRLAANPRQLFIKRAEIRVPLSQTRCHLCVESSHVALLTRVL